MNYFLPLQCIFLTSFLASLSSAHSTQPHWCSCFFFFFFKRAQFTPTSFMITILAAHIAWNILSSFVCMSSSITHSDVCTCHLLRKPSLKTLHSNHTCFSPFPLILAVHIFLLAFDMGMFIYFFTYCLPFQIECIPHEAEFWICGVLLIAKV